MLYISLEEIGWRDEQAEIKYEVSSKYYSWAANHCSLGGAYLSQVLDGVDVMVGRGTDETHTRDRVTRLGNVLGHLLHNTSVMHSNRNIKLYIYIRQQENKSKKLESVACNMLPPGNNTAITHHCYRMTYGCIIPGWQCILSKCSDTNFGYSIHQIFYLLDVTFCLVFIFLIKIDILGHATNAIFSLGRYLVFSIYLVSANNGNFKTCDQYTSALF
jgi:hypothetical protein